MFQKHACCVLYSWPGVAHAGLHSEVQHGLPIEEADRITEEVNAQIHEGIDSGDCVIHVYPAQPDVLSKTEILIGVTPVSLD
jgi:divalent metal cation (Fe/Co/Zn/Cd) transporter